MEERMIVVDGVEVPCPAYEAPVVGDAVLLLGEDFGRKADGRFGAAVVLEVGVESPRDPRPGCVVRTADWWTERGDRWESWVPLAELGLITDATLPYAGGQP